MSENSSIYFYQDVLTITEFDNVWLGGREISELIDSFTISYNKSGCTYNIETFKDGKPIQLLNENDVVTGIWYCPSYFSRNPIYTIEINNVKIDIMADTISVKNVFYPMIDDAASLPNEAGLYMIAARDNDAIQKLLKGAVIPKFEEYDILYVGISSKQGLRRRDFKNHFQGTARNSTLRKSLGALFPWENCREYYNDGRYRFNRKRENELSVWMKNNLVLISWTNSQELHDQGLEELEKDLINKLDPPLNIKNNSGLLNATFRQELRILRSGRIDVGGGGRMTLHEAIQLVLMENNNKSMHASDIAEIINARELYRRGDGENVPPWQVLLRCNKYPHLFEIIESEMVRLIQV